MIFWVCWVMTWSSRGLSHDQDEEELILPDINHLISSAVVSCVESSDGFDAWDCDLWNLADELSAGKIYIWAVKTVPNLADCFQQFVRFRIQKAAEEPRNGIGVSISKSIFINEDFSKITIRHSAVDKTYQLGSLTPNQGFLPVEDAISDVCVWGLGGRRAKEVQLFI